jgi:hypothetical protein
VSEPTILEGRITHMRYTFDFTADFRLNGGAVTCRAHQPYSTTITEQRGYPGHNVRVAGRMVDKKVLAVDSLTVLD